MNGEGPSSSTGVGAEASARTLVSVAIGDAVLRLRRTADGLAVVVSRPRDGVPDSRALTTTRHATADEAAETLFREVLASGEALARRLRDHAVRAATKAVAARMRMRRGGRALRQLEDAAATAAERYLGRGREAMSAALAAESKLISLGFKLPDRSIPRWMDELVRGLKVDEQDREATSA